MGKPLRALIVEDVEDDALLLSRHLKKAGFALRFERVENAKSMRAALENGVWDVILCDFKLPGFGAEKALKIAEKAGYDQPFIVVSGTIGEEKAADMMRAGANDLILKDNFSRLVPAIERGMKAAAVRRERKRIETELRDTEAKFRSLFEGSNQGLLVHRHFKPIQANGALARMFGYGSPDEILKLKSSLGLLAPDERTRIQRYHEARLEGSPVPQEFDVKGLRKDGSVFWLNSRSFRIDWPDGSAICTTLFDISEHKAAEEERREREALFNAVVNRSPTKIHIKDAEGRYILINREAEKLFGVTDEEGRGKTSYDLFERKDADVFMAHDRVVIESGTATEEEEEFTLDDGVHTYFTVKFPIYDQDRIVAVGAIGTDITEKKNTERALKESEQRFRSAFESAGHGVALVGLDGRWLDVNQSLCDITGYDREELLAIDFQAITHPDDLAADLENVRHLIDSEIPSYQMEKRYIRKDGSEVPIILSVGLVRDAEGEPLYFVSQIVDISAWKEAETKLQQAQKMEAVGNLTGGIAHDFNNILGIVLGNLQLLRRRLKDDDGLQSLIEAGIDATHHGADLTKRLLAFSRRQDLDPQVLDVNALVAGMDRILRRTLGEQIEIETVLGGDLGLTKVDSAQLESALLNLALNARDAMPDGGRLMIETSNAELDDTYVATHSFAAAGPHVCISVCDTGTGIPEELRELIFEPFFTTKDVGKGTGLGLSMVYGFVKQSGGHVNVYSEQGHGTRFRLYLPRTDEAAADVDGEETSGPDELPRGSETVLLVEDDEQFRRTAALLLEDLGYTVVSEVDGPSALNAMEMIPIIDLLFTDMIMPGGINGHELAERARERRPGLPVLLASGYPRDAFHEGRKFPLLSKPYTDVELARRIRRVLDARKMAED